MKLCRQPKNYTWDKSVIKAKMAIANHHGCGRAAHLTATHWNMEIILYFIQ